MMRKISVVFLCLFCCIFAVFISACSNSNNGLTSNNVSSDLVDYRTKSYYAKIGYFELSISDELTCENSEVVNFNDGSSMIKGNTVLSLSYNGVSIEDFINNQKCFMDFDSLTMLSALNINGEDIKLSELDSNDLKIRQDSTIETVYSALRVVGVGLECYPSEESEKNISKIWAEDDEIKSDNKNLLLIYNLKFENFSKIQKNMLKNNVYFNLTITGDESKTMSFSVESPTTNVECYVIMADEENELFQIKMRSESNNFKLTGLDKANISKISITLMQDLTLTDVW